MSGDLILEYERIARRQDSKYWRDHNRETFTSIGSKVLAAIGDNSEKDLVSQARIEAQIDEAIAAAWEPKQEAIRAAYGHVVGLCESPIERMILPWLISQPYQFFAYEPLALLPAEARHVPDLRIAVVPQLEIGRYRVDFALIAKRGGHARAVIVECDGEEFHKDVHRDVARDAALLRHDRILDVCFLTGKEIWKNPKAAAAKAARAVLDAWSVKNNHVAHKFGS